MLSELEVKARIILTLFTETWYAERGKKFDIGSEKAPEYGPNYTGVIAAGA
jgi:hypothetical protein